MKSLFAIAILFLAGCIGCTSLPTQASEKDLAVQLNFPSGGLCSGTPVSRTAILTAYHCVDDAPTSMTVDGQPTVITRIISDGKDHALLLTQMRYKSWASFGALPRAGDQVHIWGNPAGLNDLYRSGWYIGLAEGVYLYDMNVWHGDSGAAVLNDRGEVVGVITGYFIEHNPAAGSSFRVTIVYPFAFSAKDWAAAGIKSPQPAEWIFTGS